MFHRFILVGVAAAATLGGCADRGGNAPTPKRVNERRQARERDTQTLLAYCNAGQEQSASAVPSRRDARPAVDTLLAQVPEYDGSSYARQYLVRRTLASLLERRRCLSDDVPAYRSRPSPAESSGFAGASANRR